MDRKAFAVSVGMLSDSLPPKQKLTDLAAEGYWLGLKDLSDDQLKTAFLRALRTCRFMPSPAELRELAGAGIKTKSLIAWDAVRAAMRKHGYAMSVDFGPLVNAVIRNMGGWLHLDGMSTDELNVWGKKEFERVYDLLCLKDPKELNGSALVGAFGGPAVPVLIAGELPPQRKLEAVDEKSEVVRQLAESKS